jgi:hypothetical protein
LSIDVREDRNSLLDDGSTALALFVVKRGKDGSEIALRADADLWDQLRAGTPASIEAARVAMVALLNSLFDRKPQKPCRQFTGSTISDCEAAVEKVGAKEPFTTVPLDKL